MNPVRPRHIALFILACLLLLGAICAVAEFNKPLLGSMRWPTLSEKLGLPKQTVVIETDSAALAELKEFPDSLEIPNVLDTISAPVVAKKPIQTDTLRPVTPAKAPLQAFREALAEAGTKQVRVVHYAGAGEVGTHLAKLLSRENMEISLMDESPEKLGDLDAEYDMLTKVGSPTSETVYHHFSHVRYSHNRTNVARRTDCQFLRTLCPFAPHAEVCGARVVCLCPHLFVPDGHRATLSFRTSNVTRRHRQYAGTHFLCAVSFPTFVSSGCPL